MLDRSFCCDTQHCHFDWFFSSNICVFFYRCDPLLRRERLINLFCSHSRRSRARRCSRRMLRGFRGLLQLLLLLLEYTGRGVKCKWYALCSLLCCVCCMCRVVCVVLYVCCMCCVRVVYVLCTGYVQVVWCV